MRIKTKRDARNRVRHRISRKVRGTGDRPRLCVFRSNKHIYAQIVDDVAGRTLVAASSCESAIQSAGNRDAAKEVGKLVAERLKDKGLEGVVFDRGGFKYHGRVQALAEAAREAGLKF